MNLTVISQTALRVTVGWTPPAGVEGYEFFRDGTRVSSTFDGSKSQVTFSIPDGNQHTFEVRALSQVGSGTVTVNGPVDHPDPSGAWWWGSSPPPPEAPPAATLDDVTSQSALKTLCATGGRGGVARVRDFTYSGNLDIGNRNGLTLVFDSSFSLVGPAGSALPAVGVHGSGLRLFGGDISNPNGGSGSSGGDGVKAYVGSADSGPVSYLWHSLKIHDCAAQGLTSQGSRYAINGDVQAEISRCGLNTSLDPHTIKGTGLHASYLGGGDTPTTGRYVLYVHDQPTGAGLQCGAHFQNAEVWLSARNLTWTKDRYAGNAFQPWGGGNGTVRVHLLLVDGAQNGVVTESLSSGQFTVEHGRYRNVRLTAVQSSSHLIMQDWAAA